MVINLTARYLARVYGIKVYSDQAKRIIIITIVVVAFIVAKTL